MNTLSHKDIERLRALAQRQMAFARSPENDIILKKWEALGAGRRETPTVRLLFSNFTDEVIAPRLQCECEAARRLEWSLLSNLVGRELFNDDTPVTPTFDIVPDTWATPYGHSPHLTRSQSGKGFHIDPVIEDLSEELDKLRGGHFGADRAKTKERMSFAGDIIGDILPVRLVMPNLMGSLTNQLVQLMGMENLYLALYDAPEALHEALEMGTRIYEEYYDFLEREKLLLPTCGTSPISQESYAFNHELPADRAEKTTDVWGFLECQEFTATSPETFGEFIFPYQDRLVRRYGLLSYGCCERVDALWPDYLSKWTNLRKLSVSPFNDEKCVGEYLRGTNVVYYSKPRAEYVTNRGPLDEEALRQYFKGVYEAASGCLLEVAQREVGTIYGDYDRGRQYVRIAKECLDAYWKP